MKLLNSRIAIDGSRQGFRHRVHCFQEAIEKGIYIDEMMKTRYALAK